MTIERSFIKCPWRNPKGEGRGMCPNSARPGSEGPHVGAVPHLRWGHSNRRYSAAAPTLHGINKLNQILFCDLGFKIHYNIIFGEFDCRI